MYKPINTRKKVQVTCNRKTQTHTHTHTHTQRPEPVDGFRRTITQVKG